MTRMKLLMAAIGVALVMSVQETVPAAGFHHVHLNCLDPGRSVAFYTKTFGVTKETRVAGWDAIATEKIYLLFSKVSSPASDALNTAIWHFGWGSPNIEADYQKHLANGVPFAAPI